MANTKTAAEKAAQNSTETAEVQEAPVKRVYELRSTNKFLTVSALGVQFMRGRYKTDNPAIAKALLNYEGVELVED